MNYLNRECRLADAGQYFPDLTVRRYDFASSLLNEEQIHLLGRDPELLMDFLSGNDLKPKYDYRLREVFGCNDGGYISDFAYLQTYMNSRVHDLAIESSRRRARNLFMDENGGQPHLVLSSIRTAKGLFSSAYRTRISAKTGIASVHSRPLFLCRRHGVKDMSVKISFIIIPTEKDICPGDRYRCSRWRITLSSPGKHVGAIVP
ncbi:MAG: hypothetical protein ACLR8Y_10730 [Alistipes indistinctus]